MSKIPGFQEAIFPAKSLPQLEILAELGLLLFMFIVGLEVDVNRMKRTFKYSSLISIAGVVIPFVLGILVALPIYKLDKQNVKLGYFLLYIGVVMSITAFPVLARILSEKQLISTKIGIITLACAAIDDVIAWCIWAIIYGVIRSDSVVAGILTTFTALFYITIMFLVVRPLLSKLFNYFKMYQLSTLSTVFLFLGLLFSSALTELIGIHEIFGAFVWGIVLPRDKKFTQKLTHKIEDVTVLLLLPLYFTNSGLKTSIGELNNGKHWLILILTLITACVGKIGGCLLTAKYGSGLSWRESISLGILMNTKGLISLIILNIGFDNHFISETMFTILLIMSLLTTLITSPLLHLIYPTNLIVLNEIATFGDSFNILICLPDSRSIATKFINLIKFFVPPNNTNSKVLAIRLVSNNNNKNNNNNNNNNKNNKQKTSIYMNDVTPLEEENTDEIEIRLHDYKYENDNSYNEYNNKNKGEEEILGIALDTAQVAGINIEPIKRVTGNPEKDICYISQSQHIDLTILHCNPTNALSLLTNYYNINSNGNYNNNNKNNNNNNSNNEESLIYIMNNCNNTVGIYIDGNLTNKQRKVLVAYYGSGYDTITLKLARRIAVQLDLQIHILKMQSSNNNNNNNSNSKPGTPPLSPSSSSPNLLKYTSQNSFKPIIQVEDILLEDALKNKNISLAQPPPSTNIQNSLSFLTSLTNDNSSVVNTSASARINNQVDTELLLSELSNNSYDLLMITLCDLENANTIKELIAKMPISLLIIKQAAPSKRNSISE